MLILNLQSSCIAIERQLDTIVVFKLYHIKLYMYQFEANLVHTGRYQHIKFHTENLAHESFDKSFIKVTQPITLLFSFHL
jgi:hypothetical protein